MSAFGGKADMTIAPRKVRNWPKADIQPFLPSMPSLVQRVPQRVHKVRV